MKKCITIISILCLFFAAIYSQRDFIFGQEDRTIVESNAMDLVSGQSDEFLQEQANSNIKIDGDGKIVPADTTYDADGNIIKPRMKNRARNATLLAAYEEDPTYGFVDFQVARKGDYVKYTNVATGESGNIGGNATDAAYLGRNNGKIRFKMAGVIGDIDDNSEVKIVADSPNVYVSFYKVKNGMIYHHYLKGSYNSTNNFSNSYYGSAIVGPQQSYMESNKVYYSYDGHYFYSDTTKMLDDYRKNTNQQAINANQPYYNYYQFLSHRSLSVYDATVYDKFIENRGNAISKMLNLGNDFISNQNKYGVNALLMFGVACNESAYGMSSIAQNNNNLFGHSAYDSDPAGSANKYSSPAFSVYYHAARFVSYGYLDPLDWRYEGSHLGDKGSGINVRYATDPYWGEVAAGINYDFDSENGNANYGLYTIGIKRGNENVNIRKEPNTSSTALYSTNTATDYPFIILEKVKGEVVNGSDVWYKIQSDPILNFDRSAIVVKADDKYNFDNNYAYVHSSYVTYLGDGKGKPINPPFEIKRGDVNSDGKINTLDYIAIENHITNRKVLAGEPFNSADVNGDGKVNTLDYIAVENHITGRKLIS
ncbi:MAG: dockerin type I domain-containing protein [Erysipelotrichaceae bacterium]